MRWSVGEGVGWVLLVSGAMLLVSAGGVSAEASGGPEDWPMFGLNPARTGAVESPGGDAVAQEWAFEAGNDVRSSPAVVDGTVYVGSISGHLYAIDATTGDERWAFETRDSVRSSPAVVDGTVYVGSKEGTVYAIDAATGNEVWSFQAEPAVPSSPAVVDGTVYVGSNDGTLYAIDKITGEARWTFEPEGAMAVPTDPAVAGGRVFVSDTGESVGGSVYALDADTGEQVWSRDGARSSPAVANGTVYVGSLLDALHAFDADTGERRWSYETEGRVAAPAVSNGTVYAGSEDGNVYALDASTGEERWTFETGSWVESSPAVAGDQIFVGSADENVYALDAASGEQVWAFEAGDYVRSSPAVVDGTVYVGSDAGAVYALSTTDADATDGAGTGGTSSPDEWIAERGEGWTKVVDDVAVDGEKVGRAVAVADGTAVVSADGAGVGDALVFERMDGAWRIAHEIDPDNVYGRHVQSFGSTLSLDQDTLLAGAPYHEAEAASEGKAYVYVRSEDGWTRQQRLSPENPETSDLFGSAVSVHGDTAVVGAASADAAYVFIREAGNWTQVEKLETPTTDEETVESFGAAVDVRGERIVVGAPEADGDGVGRGAAYVFSDTGEGWTRVETLRIPDAQDHEKFGNAVSLDRDRLAIGALDEREDSGGPRGAVFVYQWGSDGFEQIAKLRTDEGGKFGQDVSLEGDRLAVGAPFASTGGRAYVYELEDGAFERATVLAPDTFEKRARFGDSVSLNGSTVAVGMPEFDGDGYGRGAGYLFDLTSYAGAAPDVEVRLGSPRFEPEDPGVLEELLERMREKAGVSQRLVQGEFETGIEPSKRVVEARLVVRQHFVEPGQLEADQPFSDGPGPLHEVDGKTIPQPHGSETQKVALREDGGRYTTELDQRSVCARVGECLTFTLDLMQIAWKGASEALTSAVGPEYHVYLSGSEKWYTEVELASVEIELDDGRTVRRPLDVHTLTPVGEAMAKARAEDYAGVAVASPVNLTLRDPAGNPVGFKIGDGGGPQALILSNPDEERYQVEVRGTGEGTYSLVYGHWNGESLASFSTAENQTIKSDQRDAYDLRTGGDAGTNWALWGGLALGGVVVVGAAWWGIQGRD